MFKSLHFVREEGLRVWLHTQYAMPYSFFGDENGYFNENKLFYDSKNNVLSAPTISLGCSCNVKLKITSFSTSNSIRFESFMW